MSTPSKPFPPGEFVGPGIEVSRRNGRFTDAELRHNVEVSKTIRARKAAAPKTPCANNWRKLFQVLQ